MNENIDDSQVVTLSVLKRFMAYMDEKFDEVVARIENVSSKGSEDIKNENYNDETTDDSFEPRKLPTKEKYLPQNDINDVPKITKETISGLDGKVLFTPTVTKTVHSPSGRKVPIKVPCLSQDCQKVFIEIKEGKEKICSTFCYTVMELSSVLKKLDEIKGPPIMKLT